MSKIDSYLSNLSIDELINFCGASADYIINYKGERINLGREYFLRKEDKYSDAKNSLLACGCTFDTELMFNLAKKSGERSTAEGLCLHGEINCGVIREPMKSGAEYMLSEDPHVVYSLCNSFIKALGGNVLLSGFLGGEDEFAERNIDERAFNEIYHNPFLRLKRDATAVLAGGGLFRDEKVCTSKTLAKKLTANTKDNLLIVSAFGACDNAVEAIKAGAGYIVPFGDKDKKEIKAAIENNTLTKDELVSFVRRAAGFCQKVIESVTSDNKIYRPYDADKELAKKSIVLLENSGVLPLKNTDCCEVFNGGYIGGFDFGNQKNDANVAVVFGKNDNGKLNESAVKILKEQKTAGKETVLVIVSERPCEIGEECFADAVLYIPQVLPYSTEALKNILTGEAEPCGRLSVTWAKRACDYPAELNPRVKNKGMFTYESVYNGYRYFDTFSAPVKYCFGHGLGYAQSQIENAKLSTDKDALLIDFSIKNLSDRICEEVIFAFDNYTDQPVFGLKKRLVGFERVRLEKGETKAVHMRIDFDDFTIYNFEKKCFTFLGGKHEITLGYSSQNLVKSGEIKFKKSSALSGVTGVTLADKDAQDFGFCNEKKYPSYYHQTGFAPKATEVENLIGKKLYTSSHGYEHHIISDDNKPNDLLVKKAKKALAKTIKSSFDYDLSHIPKRLLERIVDK